MTVQSRAELNLEKVIKAVGAKSIEPHLVELPVKQGKRTIKFRVGPGAVWLENEYQTCYQLDDAMPHEESMASVLLLLKNDPAIFWDWVNRNGYRVTSTRKWTCT